jgi:hypothetical protein
LSSFSLVLREPFKSAWELAVDLKLRLESDVRLATAHFEAQESLTRKRYELNFWYIKLCFLLLERRQSNVASLEPDGLLLQFFLSL